MRAGWVREFRGEIDEAPFDGDLARYGRWRDLVGRARFSDGFERIRGETVLVPRGHVIGGLPFLEERYGFTRKAARHFVQALRLAGRIEVIPGGVGIHGTLPNLIRIVDFHRYSPSDSCRENGRNHGGGGAHPKGTPRGTPPDGSGAHPRSQEKPIDSGFGGRSNGSGAHPPSSEGHPEGHPQGAPIEVNGGSRRGENHPKNISSPVGDSPRRAGGAGTFEEFWGKVPHKIGKGSARKAFSAALANAGSVDVLVEGLRRHEKQRLKQSDPPTPIHPATFLRGERWLDDYGPDEKKPKPPAPLPQMPPEFPDWLRANAVGWGGKPAAILSDAQAEDRWMDRTWRDEFAKSQKRQTNHFGR